MKVSYNISFNVIITSALTEMDINPGHGVYFIHSFVIRTHIIVKKETEKYKVSIDVE